MNVTIKGEMFLFNDRPTYADVPNVNPGALGRLINSRMVQALFDDENLQTRDRWRYPDGSPFDPERNTDEFVAALPSYRRHGVIAVTICLQGGRPVREREPQVWHVSGFRSDGSLKPAWMNRLEKVLDAADRERIAIILGLFYFGQDERLEDEEAIKRGVINAVDWIMERGHRNVLLEIANEIDHPHYDHDILTPQRVTELVEMAKERSGGRLPVSVSFTGGGIPPDDVLRMVDFVLIHGNGQRPKRVREMVRAVRARLTEWGVSKPIVFNEDGTDLRNMEAALEEGASWGYFDAGRNNYRDGFQSPPTNWTINTPTKRAFFRKAAEWVGIIP